MAQGSPLPFVPSDLPASTRVCAIRPSKLSDPSSHPGSVPKLRFSRISLGQFSAFAPRLVWHHRILKKQHTTFFCPRPKAEQTPLSL